MKKKLLHTPEGVRDIYNDECERIQILTSHLKDTMKLYGYHPIITPTFEFFDIFSHEIGTTPSKELYKFFDREGNTLVLRPDITPSVARASAKYFMYEDMPIRFYYSGNTFINHSSYQGRLKENLQMGAELIGDNSVLADAEIISMAVACLTASGLEEFQLSIGHADFFTGLLEASGMDEETEDELRELIANKNFFGVEEVISNFKIDPDLRKLFQMMGGVYTALSDIQIALEYAKDYPKIKNALVHLEELYRVLEIYGIEKYISYEPGMISSYQYYTGIVFAGYTYQIGEPVLKGGRYDKLLSHFGKNSASIGFAIVIDQLFAALTRQNIISPIEEDTELIIYNTSRQKEAIFTAMKKRSDGKKVEIICFDSEHTKEDYLEYAARNHRTKIQFMIGETEHV
ncbi:MAG: ATP phosphoribosyltransferase regulatory subunit [Lachnospiraceae bacterium]